MTIKWVKVDPLVMNGEPFCYGTRLTVRQVLELRANGYTLVDLLKDHPELRLVGIAEAYRLRGRQQGSLRGLLRGRRLARRPGPTSEERPRGAPDRLRVPGVVIRRPRPPDPGSPAPTSGRGRSQGLLGPITTTPAERSVLSHRAAATLDLSNRMTSVEPTEQHSVTQSPTDRRMASA